jgi:hypothetical protein
MDSGLMQACVLLNIPVLWFIYCFVFFRALRLTSTSGGRTPWLAWGLLLPLANIPLHAWLSSTVAAGFRRTLGNRAGWAGQRSVGLALSLALAVLVALSIRLDHAGIFDDNDAVKTVGCIVGILAVMVWLLHLMILTRAVERLAPPTWTRRAVSIAAMLTVETLIVIAACNVPDQQQAQEVYLHSLRVGYHAAHAPGTRDRDFYGATFAMSDELQTGHPVPLAELLTDFGPPDRLAPASSRSDGVMIYYFTQGPNGAPRNEAAMFAYGNGMVHQIGWNTADQYNQIPWYIPGTPMDLTQPATAAVSVH